MTKLVNSSEYLITWNISFSGSVLDTGKPVIMSARSTGTLLLGSLTLRLANFLLRGLKVSDVTSHMSLSSSNDSKKQDISCHWWCTSMSVSLGSPWWIGLLSLTTFSSSWLADRMWTEQPIPSRDHRTGFLPVLPPPLSLKILKEICEAFSQHINITSNYNYLQVPTHWHWQDRHSGMYISNFLLTTDYYGNFILSLLRKKNPYKNLVTDLTFKLL